jgi:hypothetical protein
LNKIDCRTSRGWDEIRRSGCAGKKEVSGEGNSRPTLAFSPPQFFVPAKLAPLKFAFEVQHPYDVNISIFTLFTASVSVSIFNIRDTNQRREMGLNQSKKLLNTGYLLIRDQR